MDSKVYPPLIKKKSNKKDLKASVFTGNGLGKFFYSLRMMTIYIDIRTLSDITLLRFHEHIVLGQTPIDCSKHHLL